MPRMRLRRLQRSHRLDPSVVWIEGQVVYEPERRVMVSYCFGTGIKVTRFRTKFLLSFSQRISIPEGLMSLYCLSSQSDWMKAD